MQAGGIALALSLLSMPLQAAQQDDTIVETPGAAAPPHEKLEEQPAVDPLPDWLIDIPPEPESAARSIRTHTAKEYIEADDHVVSESRMFSVSGGDALRMGAIATHADELRGIFNNLLDISTPWKYAISIRLLGSPSDPARPRPIRTRVGILGSEPNLQIRIFPGGGIRVDKLDEAIVSMLLYEYALQRIHTAALPDYLEMPPWLITGIQQALLWKQGKIDRRLYQNLFNKADMMSPEDLVNISSPESLDAGSRQVYEVSCGVLIMGLLNREGGRDRLRNLIGEALTQEGQAKEIISTHFHEMGVNGANFSKWWALELAALSMPRTAEALTPLETERALKEALLATGIDKETLLPFNVNAADVQELLKLPNWRSQMRSCMDKLVELSLRCFPGYRAIILEYCRAFTELVNGSDPKDVQSILGPLQELRQAYIEATLRGRDYLDWFEITQLGSSGTGSFDSYIEAMRLLRQEHTGPTTPISRYLDDIEALHSLKEGDELPPTLRRATTPAKP